MTTKGIYSVSIHLDNEGFDIRIYTSVIVDSEQLNFGLQLFKSKSPYEANIKTINIGCFDKEWNVDCITRKQRQ